ncbi:MAG: hypothetical protein P8181_03675 [bacterium]
MKRLLFFQVIAWLSVVPLVLAGGGDARKPAPEAEHGLALKFTIPEHDLFPENIAYDPVSGDYFLGSMSHSRILRIHPDGSYENFIRGADTGLLGSIGMKVDAKRRLLWVCSGRFSLMADYDTVPARTGVVKFGVDDGTAIAGWMIDQDSDYHIFNDIVVASNGDAYATTTLLGRVYRWPAGSDTMAVVLQLEPGRHNNGIALDSDGKYLFLTVDRSIYRFELGTQNLTELSIPDNGGLGTDGLYVYKNSLVSVKPRFKQIAQIFLNENHTAADRVVVLADGHEDFEYPTTGVIVGDKLVFVATSYANALRNLDSTEQHPDVRIYEVDLATE